jgi:hypothetical protein
MELRNLEWTRDHEILCVHGHGIEAGSWSWGDQELADEDHWALYLLSRRTLHCTIRCYLLLWLAREWHHGLRYSEPIFQCGICQVGRSHTTEPWRAQFELNNTLFFLCEMLRRSAVPCMSSLLPSLSIETVYQRHGVSGNPVPSYAGNGYTLLFAYIWSIRLCMKQFRDSPTVELFQLERPLTRAQYPSSLIMIL